MRDNKFITLPLAPDDPIRKMRCGQYREGHDGTGIIAWNCEAAPEYAVLDRVTGTEVGFVCRNCGCMAFLKKVFQ